jgi:hypothetical protein
MNANQLIREKPFTDSMTMAKNLDGYAVLLQRIRDDLRLQHPEWIQPNGECPTCDSYEARLMELLAGSNEADLTRPRLSRTEL